MAQKLRQNSEHFLRKIAFRPELQDIKKNKTTTVIPS